MRVPPPTIHTITGTWTATVNIPQAGATGSNYCNSFGLCIVPFTITDSSSASTSYNIFVHANYSLDARLTG